MEVNLSTIINRHMNWFSKYGIDEEQLWMAYRSYKDKQPKASDSDFVWYIFNLILSENARQTTDLNKFYQYQIEVLLNMLEFIRRYEDKKGNDILQDIERQRIEQYRLLTYKVMVKVASGHCCYFCDSLNEKLYTIEEYLNEEPLGSKKCTKERGCNCRTLAMPQRDNNGRLIML